MPRTTPIERKRRTFKTLDKNAVQTMIGQRQSQFEQEMLGHELNLTTLEGQLSRAANTEDTEALQKALDSEISAISTLEQAVSDLEAEKAKRK